MNDDPKMVVQITKNESATMIVRKRIVNIAKFVAFFLMGAIFVSTIVVNEIERHFFNTGLTREQHVAFVCTFLGLYVLGNMFAFIAERLRFDFEAPQ